MTLEEIKKDIAEINTILLDVDDAIERNRFRAETHQRSMVSIERAELGLNLQYLSLRLDNRLLQLLELAVEATGIELV